MPVLHKMLLTLILLLATTVSWAECSGPHQGIALSAPELTRILKDNPKANLCKVNLDNVNLSQMNLHGVNLEQASLTGVLLHGTDLSRANLAGADFSGSQLKKTYFRWANLESAKFSEATLKDVIFSDANLRHSHFSRARLAQVNFDDADLSHANFILASGHHLSFNFANLGHANLTLTRFPKSQFKSAKAFQARFNEAQLSLSNFDSSYLKEVSFDKANLYKVNFTDADLSGADFQYANLLQVKYYPSLEGLPELSFLATSLNFNTILFYRPEIGAPAFGALQAAYKQNGVRSMERLTTSMLKTAQMHANIDKGGLSKIEGLISYVLFYLTCDFGLAPGRPLTIFAMMCLFLTFPYYLSFGARSPHSGIVVSWQSRRDPTYMLEASYQHFVKIHAHDPWISRVIKRYQRLSTALYFSILSSFKIGWQDFNLATWITLVQTKDYSFTAKGWVRSLAGLQSIISAYLLVLWALAYFGRPFEW